MSRISPDRFAQIRVITMGCAGIVCLAYGLSALWLARPDPFFPGLPALFGLAAVLITAGSGMIAGQDSTTAASDEGYLADTHKAQRYSFWFALCLYPLFGAAIWAGWGDFKTAFAAMGTLTAACFLLLFVGFDQQGRR